MENIGILPGRKKVSAISRCPLYRVSAIDRYDCTRIPGSATLVSRKLQLGPIHFGISQ